MTLQEIEIIEDTEPQGPPHRTSREYRRADRYLALVLDGKVFGNIPAAMRRVHEITQANPRDRWYLRDHNYRSAARDKKLGRD